MAVSIKRTSRLKFATLRLVEGYTFFDVPVLPEVLSFDDDITYIVQDTDRIDLLSNKFYGTSDYWWVIAAANGIRQLPRDLQVGSSIKIPTKERVLTKILSSFKSRV